MVHLLDNIFWHSLTGPQACWAVGDAGDIRALTALARP